MSRTISELPDLKRVRRPGLGTADIFVDPGRADRSSAAPVLDADQGPRGDGGYRRSIARRRAPPELAAMTFKHVLVHIEPGPASEARLKYAIGLARSFGASLTGLTVTSPPAEIPAAMIGDAQLFNAAVEAARESAEFAKQQFEGLMRECGLITDWRNGQGIPAQVVGAEAGRADVLVVGGQVLRDMDAGLYRLAPDDVLMTCGRPTIVLPENLVTEFRAKRILLAWKNTAEAARAAHDAIPLLIQAEEVIVAELVSSDAGTGRYSISIEDMAGHLRAHGAKITTAKLQGQAAGAGDLLLTLASERGVDLIVAGAYGHSRLREWALGGVTATLLRRAHVPCLLSR
jgi:nucleotide-binding universal stress UspA family protein